MEKYRASPGSVSRDKPIQGSLCWCQGAWLSFPTAILGYTRGDNPPLICHLGGDSASSPPPHTRPANHSLCPLCSSLPSFAS